MNRDEILKRSRVDNAAGDERDKAFATKGAVVSFVSMIAITAAYSFVKSRFLGESTQDFIAIIWLGIAIGNFYQYIALRQRRHLGFGIIWLICGALFAVSYVVSVQGLVL